VFFDLAETLPARLDLRKRTSVDLAVTKTI